MVEPSHLDPYSPVADRTSFVVDEAEMRIVRRIFHMVGAEGRTLYGVRRAFEREGLSAPGEGRYQNMTYVRRTIANDVYRPHTREEVKALLLPELAALRASLSGRTGMGIPDGVWQPDS